MNNRWETTRNEARTASAAGQRHRVEALGSQLHYGLLQHYGDIAQSGAQDANSCFAAFATRLTSLESLATEVKIPADGDGMQGIVPAKLAEMVLDSESMARQAFDRYGKHFRPGIWNCCSRCCFVDLVFNSGNTGLISEVLEIHAISEGLHGDVEKSQDMVEQRRRGVGGSHMAFNMPQRSERGTFRTNRQEALRQLAKFVIEVLPFLYGNEAAPNGTPPPARKFCSEAICCILGVSRNFLYRRRTTSSANTLSEEEVLSLVDTAEVRMRQNRRRGSRVGYPEVSQLPQFRCGCSTPCLAPVPLWRLYKEYKAFTVLSKGLKPRRMENRYLLNTMFCPLLNSTIAVCDRAISALYTVSQSVVADVRLLLENMCNEPVPDEQATLQTGVDGYKKTPSHPMNRYSDDIRDRIELHLDMVLRADPGASDGVNTCRVYSPEVNTQEKLRNLVAINLGEDEGADVHLSASTLQRMIQDYLKARSCRISFLQSDHNACPTCKTLKYALLQFSFEVKTLEAKHKSIAQSCTPSPPESDDVLRKCTEELSAKKYQESTTLQEFQEHNLRDAKIRRFLKQLGDHLRSVENSYREFGDSGRTMWRGKLDHGLLTHQDDMTKIDLPHFIETASSDITRWRHDVNAHVSAVNNESIVFSHEQGSGAKNASTIMELILLDHLLRCRGEALKVVVSDNASVGKNWLTCVALPQYMVDQGLADVVVMVFLENNQGKWLADMLFGQLQMRRRRTTITGIDALLREFEGINRAGPIHGFAVNPLASVDFHKVMSSLGYETKPPKRMGFTKRNIHFAAACAPGALARMPVDLRNIMGEMLPNEPGMVRLSTEPPDGVPNLQRKYHCRYFDVPAASPQAISSVDDRTLSRPFFPSTESERPEVPFVVPLNQKYEKSGPGVVSTRNMEHVGYNGLEFRKLNACPELRNDASAIVKEAWPAALVDRSHASRLDPNVSEHLRCAPENWVVRRPVCHFKEAGKIVSRYPPRNMLNSRYRRPPRDSHASEDERWIPTATYTETPLPVRPELCSFTHLGNCPNKNGPFMRV